jgi:trk system potassium uptake protein TrkA
MKVVILGAGRRGTLLARHLIQEKKDVILIESDPIRAADAESRLDCLVIVGSGTDSEKLREAGVETCDAFIAVSDSDEINLVACGIVESLATKVTTVATIRNLTYTGADGLPQALLGIDSIVNPEAETARSIAESIERGIFSDVISFDKTNLTLYNIYVTENSPFVGQDLATLRSTLNANFIITAVNRDEQGIVPSGNTRLEIGDTLSLVASERDIETIFSSLGRKRIRPHKIVIVGGSKIARFLLREFSPAKRHNVVLIEKDAVVCETIAQLFPEILVIKADITEEGIFNQERLDNFDLLIALTDNDELNVITASYAKRVGIRRSLALIKSNNNYIRLARHLEIDSVISVSQATVDSLLKYLRSANVMSVHSLFGGRFEIFEFTLQDSLKIVGKRLKDINMRGKGVIAAITTTDGKSVLPAGEYRLAAGDTLLVSVGRDFLHFIENLFT